MKNSGSLWKAIASFTMLISVCSTALAQSSVEKLCQKQFPDRYGTCVQYFTQARINNPPRVMDINSTPGVWTPLSEHNGPVVFRIMTQPSQDTTYCLVRYQKYDNAPPQEETILNDIFILTANVRGTISISCPNLLHPLMISKVRFGAL